jgi:excisionase family DNA binding protein
MFTEVLPTTEAYRTPLDPVITAYRRRMWMTRRTHGAEVPPEKTELGVVYTPAEVARLLKVGRRTVLDWIKRGELKAIRIGKLYRIPADELRALRERAR